MRTGISASGHRWKKSDLVAVRDTRIAQSHILIDRGTHRPAVCQLFGPRAAAATQQLTQRLEIAHAGRQCDLLRRRAERFTQPCKVQNSNHHTGLTGKPYGGLSALNKK